MSNNDKFRRELTYAVIREVKSYFYHIKPEIWKFSLSF